MQQLNDPGSDYFLDPTGYDSQREYDEAVHVALIDRHHYSRRNSIQIHMLARRHNPRTWCKLPPQTKVEVTNGKTEEYTIKSTALLVDDAFAAVVKENESLANVLARDTYARLRC